MITIDTRVLGRKQPLIPDFSIPLPPELHGGGRPTTLRDLIARVVTAEVSAFQERQDRQKFVRALNAEAIEQGVARGKVDMGGRDLDQQVDPEAAVGTALQAFEDGIYLVVVDGEEQRELDREIYLKPDSRVTFLRLTLLAGG